MTVGLWISGLFAFYLFLFHTRIGKNFIRVCIEILNGF
jgi:hypothetical protein